SPNTPAPGGGPIVPAPTGRKTGGLLSPDPNVHLFDRLAIIVKHWKAAVVVAIFVIAAMMYQTYTTVPLYRAQARIQIDEEQTTAQTDFKQPELVYTDPEPYYQTQYKILQGRDLALRAVKRLTLAQVPEFNGKGPDPPFLTQLIAQARAKIEAPFRSTAVPTAAPLPPVPPNDNQQADAF